MISPFEDGVYGAELDAFTEYGIRMGDGFIDTLLQPSPLKDYLSNESRLENGVRVDVTPSKINKRSVTLTFVVTNRNGSAMIANLRKFYTLLYGKKIRIRVPEVEDSEYYHLIYTGKSISFGSSLDRSISKLSVKFDEPNPANRTK